MRQLADYGRQEGERTASLLDDLYRPQWGQFRNFFCPVMKQLRAEVIGSRKRRIYDESAAPFQRLKACRKVSRNKTATQQKIFDSLDPFELKHPARNQWKFPAF